MTAATPARRFAASSQASLASRSASPVCPQWAAALPALLTVLGLRATTLNRVGLWATTPAHGVAGRPGAWCA